MFRSKYLDSNFLTKVLSTVPFQEHNNREVYQDTDRNVMTTSSNMKTVSTYKSPLDPDASLSPIFNNLLSISASTRSTGVANAFSTADIECEEPDHEPYKVEGNLVVHTFWSPFMS